MVNSRSIPVRIAKYLAHGLVFAVVTFAATFLWGLLAPRMSVDLALLALVLVFVALSVGYGVLNTLLTGKLWFPMRKGTRIFVGHGLLLFFAFFFVEYLEIYALIPLLMDVALLEQVLIVLLLTVLYALGGGYIAKSIGGHWRVLGVKSELMERTAAMFKEPEIKANNPDGVHCPRCGGMNMVVAADHSAYCIDCKRGHRREVLGHSST